ncbi:DNA adenine methylase [Rossellomorea vietnamensis]|uniref:site-specific DNA-methyltransferase (adenine-specific) n=1 Tax=Rossellomorea vietnamensis TaxID=218284 RepID=A0A6I6UCC3_9BACI|nr:DNA adenine methylase [Rossellomorea vietnamensis]QHE60395.1 DNA adenine methylase [Rossellomorea vietnamensis]
MGNPSPLRYPGGKYKTYEYIKQLIIENNCKTYIEPFAGGAAVAINLLLEGAVKKIIINDYDRSIYALWYSILFHPRELTELVYDTQITIEEWHRQKEIQKNKNKSSLLSLGFSTLFLNRTNRSGIVKGGVIGGKDQSGNYLMDCRFPKEKLVRKINIISNLKDQIQIHNLDALIFIENVIKNTRGSFTFFDPPYFRKGPSLYTNFYNEEDHLLLANKIQKELKNRKWIVSYDNSPKIKEMYQKLQYIEYYLNYSVSDKRKGIEFMFFSKNTSQSIPCRYLNIYEDEVVSSC